MRATCHQTSLQHTQILVALCQELGWLVNKEMSELEPKQVFNFTGYQFDLREGKVRPTPERWQTLTDKILSILSGPVYPVRQFMSLIGLLTATEKQVHLGRLHTRPIQWHLKNNWRVPESLEPFKQNGPFTQKCFKLYAPSGISLKWTCLPPDSTTNSHSLFHRSQTPGLGSGYTQPVLGKSGPMCLPTSSHLGQSGGEVTGIPLQQDHFDRPRAAQHALVLGSSGNVQSDPSVSAQPTQSGISTIQPDPAQEPIKPERTCLAPRTTAIKEQGFSEAVAA